MKLTIKVSPLSVNDAWKGKRYKTDNYLQYETDVSLLLPINKNEPYEPYESELFVKYVWYFKNYKGRDNDNPLKPFQDILKARGYLKDDRYIKASYIKKESVSNIEEERIEVEIIPWSEMTIDKLIL